MRVAASAPLPATGATSKSISGGNQLVDAVTANLLNLGPSTFITARPTLKLKVVPRASRNAIVGWIGDRLKVAVTAPPEKGRANAAVVKLLARELGVRQADLRITTGETSSAKTVVIDAHPSVLLGLPPR